MAKLEPWWGSTDAGKAHYFPTIETTRKGSVAACGAKFDLLDRERPWTRRDLGGNLWPKCEPCSTRAEGK